MNDITYWAGYVRKHEAPARDPIDVLALSVQRLHNKGWTLNEIMDRYQLTKDEVIALINRQL